MADYLFTQRTLEVGGVTMLESSLKEWSESEDRAKKGWTYYREIEEGTLTVAVLHDMLHKAGAWGLSKVSVELDSDIELAHYDTLPIDTANVDTLTLQVMAVNAVSPSQHITVAHSA